MSIEWDSLILGGGNELKNVGPATENWTNSVQFVNLVKLDCPIQRTFSSAT